MAEEALSSYEFTVFAEDYRFFAQDGSAEIEPPETIDDDLLHELFAVGERVIAVGTARPNDVQVTVEIFASKPEEEPPDTWDQIVECAVDLPSGALVIIGSNDDYAQAPRISLPPGMYAARICYGLLDEVDDDGFEGDDFYKLVIWRDEWREPRVLKRWSPAISFAPDSN